MIFSSISNRTISLSSVVMRTPSIRFRYGASRDLKSPQTSTSSGASNALPQPGVSGESIYDFQLPQRWKRRPISEEEIAYINRGGPE